MQNNDIATTLQQQNDLLDPLLAAATTGRLTVRVVIYIFYRRLK